MKAKYIHKITALLIALILIPSFVFSYDVGHNGDLKVNGKLSVDNSYIYTGSGGGVSIGDDTIGYLSFGSGGNLILGQNAGCDITAGANGNLFFGVSSGCASNRQTKLVTEWGFADTDMTGSKNVCLGSLSCELLRDGTQNYLIGYSVAAIANGVGNIATGFHAGSGWDYDSNYNIGFGYEASMVGVAIMESAFTGDYNIGMGFNAGPQTMGYTYDNANLVEKSTWIGYRAQIGGETWIAISNVSTASYPITITATAHGLVTGDKVTFRDIPVIFDHPTGANTCTLNQGCYINDNSSCDYGGNFYGMANPFVVTVTDANNFTLDGTTSGNISNCTNGSIGEFMKYNASPSSYSRTTVIGANARADCSDCLVFGKDGDVVGIGKSKPDTTLHLYVNPATVNRDNAIRFENAINKWDMVVDRNTNDFYFYNYGGGGYAIQIVDTTGAIILGSTDTVTIDNILNLSPITTAPSTCSIGNFYVDDSGAACFCDSSNNWIEMGAGAGSCS